MARSIGRRNGLVRSGLLATAAALLSGCTVDAFTYTTSHYGTTTVRHVRLGCQDTYEVYDRPDAGTILVVTNGLNESIASLCGGGPETLPRPERMRRVARLFLEETTDRPGCRVSRETDVTPLHTEFGYRCGPPPAGQAATAGRARR